MYVNEILGFIHADANEKDNTIKILDKSLDKYSLFVRGDGIEYELLSDDLKYLSNLIKIGDAYEILKKDSINKDKEVLVKTLEDFEKRINKATNIYLGTPKEHYKPIKI
jgi:hypothetical protein